MNAPYPFTAPDDYSGTGFLIVKVATADSAIPLQGASVSIRGDTEENSGVLTVLVTNRSGLTPRQALPTLPAALSAVPGNITPYATYNIDVFLDGYSPQSFQHVPIFDGITSVQGVDLIPLPKRGIDCPPGSDDCLFFENQNPNL